MRKLPKKLNQKQQAGLQIQMTVVGSVANEDRHRPGEGPDKNRHRRDFFEGRVGKSITQKSHGTHGDAERGGTPSQDRQPCQAQGQGQGPCFG